MQLSGPGGKGDGQGLISAPITAAKKSGDFPTFICGGGIAEEEEDAHSEYKPLFIKIRNTDTFSSPATGLLFL